MAPICLSIADLRRSAVRLALPASTSLPSALKRLGFVQADPLRAPARAQDLILRPRVRGYVVGDLERRYARLPVVEDFFINYGYVRDDLHALMHPRTARRALSAQEQRRCSDILAFVRERGSVHPKEVEAHFAHGRALNWFGGHSRLSTQLLEAMHYRGLLRVVRREGGTRVYALREPTAVPAQPDAAYDALVDAAVKLYAPMPAATLSQLVGMLCGGVPQWRGGRAAALERARQRLAHAQVDGRTWYWHADQRMHRARTAPPPSVVRILAPFDPLVWDRRRFELLWGWAYRFEAYVPAAKRQRGHYAMPLLWGDDVVGWVNARLAAGRLLASPGYVANHAPKDPAFAQALQAEVSDLARCLGALQWMIQT